MKRWLKRIRGAIGVGVTWGVVWGLVGGVLEAVFGLPLGASGPGIVFQEFARGFAAFAMIGFVGSGVFSTALALEGRRRAFAQMSLPRFASWGALAGLTVGMVLGVGPIGVAAMAILGTGSAAGSLLLARGADDRELLRADEELAKLGLTEEESRELLG